MVNKKPSVKSQQKKAKSYQSNKVSNIDNILEIDPKEYNFKYIVRSDGSYTISKSSLNEEWSCVNLDIDYKKLRAWRESTEIDKKEVNQKFDNKYGSIDFSF